MSTKTTIKRLAIVVVSALGMGLLSVVPASAARADTELTVDAITVTDAAPAAVAVGTMVSSTFSVSFSAASVNTNDADLTLSLTKPTNSSVTLTDANGSDAAADGKIATNGSKAATLTSTTIGNATGTNDLVTIVTGGIIAAATNTIAGTLNIKPDVPGTYTLTVTGSDLGSPSTANAVTATFTVIASAANNTSTTLVNTISLAQVTSSPQAGASVDINFLADLDSISNQEYDKSISFTGFLSAYPSGGFAQVNVSETAPSTDTEIWTTAGTGTSESVTESSSGSTYSVTLDGDSGDEDYTGNTAVASSVKGAAQFSFTPTVAGTYVLKIWNDSDLDSSIDIGEAVQTISITVAARSAISAGTSTAYIASGILPAAGTFASDSTSDSTIRLYQPVRCSKTTGTQCANILVTVKNAAGSAISGTGYTYAASISGAGNLGITGTDATYTAAASARSVSLTDDVTGDDNVFNVSVWPDGTAGTGTVTITVTDQTGATVTVATKTVNFFGTVASLSVVEDSQSYKVIRSGGYTKGITTGLTATSDTPALTLVAKDSDGNIVTGLAISATSSNTAIISASTVAEDTVARDAGYLYGGLGYYNADVTSAASSTSGQKATVTYYTVKSDGTTVSTTADYTLGGSVAKEVITFDKATYAPGEGMIITITATDSAGNPVYDGKASPAVSFSKAVGGTVPAASTYAAGVVDTQARSAGVVTNKYTVFAPVLAGEFTAQITSSATGSPVVIATATVADENASAAIDAANEATDAANAATDAANAAAEAADAATAAAQDAQAAVAELATKIQTMVAGFKAQLTTLGNLIIKIQKKVNA